LKEGEESGGVIVENDLAIDPAQDARHGFEIEPGARDLRVLIVFFEERGETRDVPFGLIDPFEGVATGFENFLAGLAAGARNDPVVFLLGDVDRFLAFLLGAVDFIERGLHRAGRVDVLELDLIDVSAEFIFLDGFLDIFQHLDFHLLPAEGEHFINSAVADHFPHDRFGEGAQGEGGVANPKEILIGIVDSVLDDPFDKGGVEITRDHQALKLRIVAGLVRVGGSGSGKAELEFQLTLGRHDIDGLDPSVAPGTGTPEPAGLMASQGLEVIRGVFGLNLIGADLVEVSPPYDTTGNTALLAANLLFEMLCSFPGCCRP